MSLRKVDRKTKIILKYESSIYLVIPNHKSKNKKKNCLHHFSSPTHIRLFIAFDEAIKGEIENPEA